MLNELGYIDRVSFTLYILMIPWVRARKAKGSIPPPLARKLDGFAPVAKMTPPGSGVDMPTPVHPVATPLSLSMANQLPSRTKLSTSRRV